MQWKINLKGQISSLKGLVQPYIVQHAYVLLFFPHRCLSPFDISFSLSVCLSYTLPRLLCTVMCLSLSLSLPLPSTTTWQINGWLPWQCNSPVTLEPLVDQNTKATCTQLSSLWLTYLKPSPTHEHRSRDKQPRIAVCSTDVHFKCLLRYCDLLMQAKMCSKTAASH